MALTPRTAADIAAAKKALADRAALLTEPQQRRVEEATATHKAVFVKAYEGGSKAAGIKAYCLACVGESHAEITHCTAKACPLYPYRPYQKGGDDEEEG